MLIRDKLRKPAIVPYAPNRNVKKLQGREGYRLRVGNRRVIYEIHADLAKACSVTAAVISQIESGKRESSVALLKKIARILKVDLDILTTTAGDSQAA